MSFLSSEIHAALTQLLQGLSSPDNNARSFAEEQLSTEWVSARPDVLLMGLVEHIQASQASGQAFRASGQALVSGLPLKGIQASGESPVSVLPILKRWRCIASH